MPLRVGMIGCGGIARVHAECLRAIGSEHAIIAGGFDAEPGVAGAFVAEFGGKVFASAEALVLAPEIEAVHICTWHDSHPALISLAIEAGKHIFCEKPLALTLREATETYRRACNYGKAFMVGYNHRFAPANLALKGILASRRIVPRVVNLSFVTAPFLEGWPATREYGGGILVCLGSHAFDLLRYFVDDEVRSVTAKAWRVRLREPYLEDVATAIVEFRGGCVATLAFHDLGSHDLQVFPGRNMVRTEVFGEEGSAIALGLGNLTISFRGESEELAFEPYEMKHTWGYLEENRRFLLAAQAAVQAPAQTRVQAEGPAIPGARDGLEAARLVEAARRSSMEGRAVELGSLGGGI